MTNDRDLSARSAAAIAAGMMAVALADGDAHPREVAMIESFRKDLPDDVDPAGVVLEDPWEQELLMRSVWMVALADGTVTDEEASAIAQIAQAHGVPEGRNRAVAQGVRMAMAYSLAGEEPPEA